MGDNSIFIVFSNIWSSVHLKIAPQFQACWQHRLFTLDMGSFFFFKYSFSFYLSIAVLLIFLYLNAANKTVLLLYGYFQGIYALCKCTISLTNFTSFSVYMWNVKFSRDKFPQNSLYSYNLKNNCSKIDISRC